MNTVLMIAKSMQINGFSVATYPDLPLLLDGPDILAAKDGHLVALFILQSHQTGAVQRLLFRFTLTRLTLPNYAKCVLAVPKDIDSPAIRELENHFHAIIGLGSMRNFLAAVNDKHVGQHIHPIPEFLRIIHGRRAGFLDHVSRHSSPFLAKEMRAGWTNIVPELLHGWQKSPTSRQLFFEGGLSVAISRRTRRVSVMSTLAPFLRQTFERDYILDNGVPYFDRLGVHVLLANEITAPLHDPRKPHRAAAFAGWTILQKPDLESASRILDNLHTWVRRATR